MSKRILHWDPRFPDRAPTRLTLDDTIASAFVRAGIAAAADPAEAGALSTGGAISAASLMPTVLQHGPAGRQVTATFMLPLAVAAIAIGLGLASAGPAAAVVPIATSSVLSTGAWNDTALWDDTQTWKDN